MDRETYFNSRINVRTMRIILCYGASDLIRIIIQRREAVEVDWPSVVLRLRSSAAQLLHFSRAPAVGPAAAVHVLSRPEQQGSDTDATRLECGFSWFVAQV